MLEIIKQPMNAASWTVAIPWTTDRLILMQISVLTNQVRHSNLVSDWSDSNSMPDSNLHFTVQWLLMLVARNEVWEGNEVWE